jgi:hypothetical protein
MPPSGRGGRILAAVVIGLALPAGDPGAGRYVEGKGDKLVMGILNHHVGVPRPAANVDPLRYDRRDLLLLDASDLVYLRPDSIPPCGQAYVVERCA